MDPNHCEAQPIATFRLFTKESLTKIERQIQDDKSRREREEAANRDAEEERLATGRAPVPAKEPEKPAPNPALEIGKQLPTKYADLFPPDLYGKPIEDIDEYFNDKYVSTRMVYSEYVVVVHVFDYVAHIDNYIRHPTTKLYLKLQK